MVQPDVMWPWCQEHGMAIQNQVQLCKQAEERTSLNKTKLLCVVEERDGLKEDLARLQEECTGVKAALRNEQGSTGLMQAQHQREQQAQRALAGCCTCWHGSLA